MRQKPRTLTSEQVAVLVPGSKITGPFKSGGQKVVVPIELKGSKYALKVAWVPTPEEPEETPEEASAGPPEEEEAIARIRREVGIIGEANVPELVKLGPVPFSEFRLDKELVIFYTEEWVPGEDLKTQIRAQGKLPPSDVALLGIQMCRAVDWLWAHGTVHRDIKPGNIMRREDGKFVLLDLGMALDLTDVSLTSPGITVGTPAYLSPEQLDAPRKRRMDFRSDLYALGVTMYEAATGRHPYYRPGMSSTDTIVSIQTVRPPPPTELVEGFPSELSNVIMRLLEKKPHLRYRTCDKLAAELLPISKALGAAQ
jgi:eukaryotic-like serine/threonine-protein kinase